MLNTTNEISKQAIMDQEDAIKKCMDANTKRVLILGIAGSGKSFVIHKIEAEFIKQNKKVIKTASTGIAAELINGVTLHSLLHLTGKRNQIGNVVLKRNQTIKETDVLIIDEISMIPYYIFEALIAIIEKNNPDIKIIAVGDFYQNKAVVKDKDLIMDDYNPKAVINEYYDFKKHLFWNKCFLEQEWEVMYLSKSVRQNDENFVNILSDLARGIFNEKINSIVSSTSYSKEQFFEDFTKNEELVFLSAKKKKVFEINSLCVKKIPGKEYVFETKVFTKEKDPSFHDRMNLDIRYYQNIECVYQTLVVKVGMKVMCIVNDQENRFKNGSVGIVIRVDENTVDIKFKTGKIATLTKTWFINEERNKILYQFCFVPFYACTSHKIQGHTLSEIVVDVDSIFEFGNLYTMLSRVRNPKNITLLRPITKNDMKEDKDVVELYDRIQKENRLFTVDELYEKEEQALKQFQDMNNEEEMELEL